MNKSRSLAVVLAALFMVCASFVVLSDEANAESKDTTISGADLVDALGIKRIDEPAAPDHVISGNYNLADASFLNETFVVADGASITQTCATTTFDGCTIYFKGAFSISGFSIHLKGDYVIAFDGITLDAAGVFGDADLLTLDGMNVFKSAGKNMVYTPNSVIGSIHVDCARGAYQVSGVSGGEGFLASFAYDAISGSAEIASIYDVDAGCSYDNIVFDGNFKADRYTLGYQVSTYFNDAEVTALKDSAKADSKFTKTFDVGEFKITLDSKAILALEDNGATFSVGPAGKLTERQLNAAGNRPVYTVSIGDVHDFGKGTVTVTLPYTLGAGEDATKLYVGYIADNGKVEKMPTTYENGVVTFTTNHLSDYGIFYGTFSEDDDVGANIFFYAAFAVAIVLLVVAIVPNLMKKKE